MPKEITIFYATSLLFLLIETQKSNFPYKNFISHIPWRIAHTSKSSLNVKINNVYQLKIQRHEKGFFSIKRQEKFHTHSAALGVEIVLAKL